MSSNAPYTYLIGWKDHDAWYYGVRYFKHCNPNDLWTSYFTSSKHVKEFNHFNNYKINQGFNEGENPHGG